MPPGYVFAVAASGVAAEKTGAAREKYNAASRLASTLVELWRRETGRDDPHLAAALGSSPDAAERLKAIVKADRRRPVHRPRRLLARLEHFMLESGEIIPAAGDALAGGDLRAFGRLVDRSQQRRRATAGQSDAGDGVSWRRRLAGLAPRPLGIWRRVWRQRLGPGRNGQGRRLPGRLGRAVSARTSRSTRNSPASSPPAPARRRFGCAEIAQR